MATISGRWKFNKTISLNWPSSSNLKRYYPVNFTCPSTPNHAPFTRMEVWSSGLAYYDDVGYGMAYDASSNVWNYGWDVVDFGLAQEVEEATYTLITSNATQIGANIEITYNSATTLLGAEKTATLACNGKRMKTNVAVYVTTPSWVKYNGKNTAVERGKAATLACAGKKMLSDVCVSSITHALYNGVRLPVVPESVLMGYPYAWIRKNTTSGYYDLLLSEIPFYYSNGVRDGSEKTGKPWYRLEITTAETATEWTNNTAANVFGSWGVDTARTVLWSNHDIPNGSADATDIYFYGSDLVPTE